MINQSPNYQHGELPNYYYLASAKPETRNKAMLEFVFRLLENGTPGMVVASLMSSFYWSLDNSEPIEGSYRSKMYEEYRKDDLISRLIELFIETQCDWPDWFSKLVTERTNNEKNTRTAKTDV